MAKFRLFIITIFVIFLLPATGTKAKISKAAKFINSSKPGKKENKSTELTKNKIIKFGDLEDILIKNSQQLKKYKSQIDQSKLTLKGRNAAWAPNLTISSSSIPSYETGYSENKLSSDNSTNKLKYGLDTTFEFDLIKPNRKL